MVATGTPTRKRAKSPPITQGASVRAEATIVHPATFRRQPRGIAIVTLAQAGGPASDGGDSGTGSHAQLAAFKAEVLNAFVAQLGIRSAIEFGCGDGSQLALASRISYVGDLGWELYVPMEQGLRLWETLWEARGQIRTKLQTPSARTRTPSTGHVHRQPVT